MKEMSFSCVHRRGAWVVSASGIPFHGQSIGGFISKWGDSWTDYTTFTKINNAIIIGSVVQMIIQDERDRQVQPLVQSSVSLWSGQVAVRTK